MSTTRSREHRFGVGTAEYPVSALWKVWVQGDDTYILARDLGHIIKVSLHRSGKWRVAFIEAADHNDRAQFKWERKPFSVGWTNAFQISVPIWHSGGAPPPAAPPSATTWVSNPGIGKKVNFNVLMSEAGAPHVSHVLRTDDQLIAEMRKKSGEGVWIASRTEDMTDQELDFVKSLALDLSINSAEQSSITGARLYYHAFPEDPTTDVPRIYDIDVGIGAVVNDRLDAAH